MKVLDRSDSNPNTGVIFGQPRLNDGYIAPIKGKTPEPVNSASDDLDSKEGHEPCPGGPMPEEGHQGMGKAQGPVVARPDAAPAGVKVNISGRSSLATGPAVANPDTPRSTISQK